MALRKMFKRFYYASESYNLENILRITSDCPLWAKLIDKFINTHHKKC